MSFAAFAAACCACALTFAMAGPAGAKTVTLTKAEKAAAKHELTASKATVLGVVEGLTEFLPVSSTGHLLVAERLMHVGDKTATKDAADTYTIVIQAGAILAILVLFRKRIGEIIAGLFGRSVVGRRLLIVLVLAFIPAAVIGLAAESKIKEHLLKPWPVVGAWLVGAAAIFLIGSRLHHAGQSSGRGIADITNRDALIIGFAQALALWPGTSRSLVTILAALLVGLSLAAAVEFSFILGLLTLGAATAKDVVSNGKQLTDVYGVVNPAIGFVIAFIAAIIAVRWMLVYLQRHDLKVFAWYRLAAGVATIALIASSKI